MVIIAMSTSSSNGYPRILLVALVLAVVAFVLASLQSLPPVLIAVLVFAASVVSSWVSKPDMARHSTSGNNSSASTVSAKSGDIAEVPTTSTDIYNGIAKTLYVGNLPYRANEAAIRKLFAAHGMVLSVRLVKDKETGKRRGYGFVEMPEKEAMQAIAALNESEYLQRTLKVREANEKREQGESFE